MNKSKLKSTIVIPFFNGKEFVFETIDGVRKQVRQPDEIIIVDDGSDDKESIDILDKIQKENADIIVVHQENKGISGAMNLGAIASTGDVIFQLDCDDILHERYIEKYMYIFENDETVDAVTCQYASFFDGKDYKDKKNIHHIYKPEGLIVPKIFFQNCGGGANSAYRKVSIEKINYWDERFSSYQDWGMWLKFLEHNLKLHIISEVLYYYRVREDSELRTTATTFDIEKNIDKSIRQIIQKNPKKYDLVTILRKSYNLAENNLKQKNDAILRRDQWLTQKDQTINQKTQELEQKDQIINQKQQTINQKTQELEQKDQIINQKQSQIQQMQSSKSFRLGNLFFRSLESPYKMLTFPINFVRILFEL